MGDESCKNCRFWERCDGLTVANEPDLKVIGDIAYGFCHRHPPVYAPDEGHADNDPGDPLADLNWNFPVTFGETWCGEWRPNPPS